MPYNGLEIFIQFDYTPKCEMYSYGIIAYEIMTNLVPYQFLLILFVSGSNRVLLEHNATILYKNLNKWCWSQEPQERPTFYDILSFLKKDKGFIKTSIEIMLITFIIRQKISNKKVFDTKQIRPNTIEYTKDIFRRMFGNSGISN